MCRLDCLSRGLCLLKRLVRILRLPVHLQPVSVQEGLFLPYWTKDVVLLRHFDLGHVRCLRHLSTGSYVHENILSPIGSSRLDQFGLPLSPPYVRGGRFNGALLAQLGPIEKQSRFMSTRPRGAICFSAPATGNSGHCSNGCYPVLR